MQPHASQHGQSKEYGNKKQFTNTDVCRGESSMSEVRRQAALMQRPNWGWQDEAACRGREVVLFFGPDGERQPEREIRERKAKALCDSCPVRNDCLSYAVSRPEKYGTWGGLNEDERSSERRRRMRRANAAA
jgi:WhiB family transcriptional regulator, redox-sensing transcriptional regulator